MKGLAALLLGALCVVGLAGQTDDQLFGDGQGDIVAPDGPQVDLSPILANPKPSLSGSITMSGAVYAGWTQLPDPANWAANFDKGFGYDLLSGLSFEYRPDPTFHWAASLSTGIPAGAVNWSVPSISSMYLDYTLADRVFFTLGKFGLGWGVGRLFGVNDLVSNVASDLSIKAFTPLGPLGVTAVLMLPPGATTLSQVQWAAQTEASVGPLNLALAGWYADASSPKLDLWSKTVLWGADVFAEGKLTLATAGVQAQALAGVYWEGFEPMLHVQGEWLVDSPTLGWADQSVSVAASWANIPGTALKPSGKVTYALVDNSGQVVLGLETDPFPHIHVTLGFPLSWGDPGSRWVTNTVAAYHEAWALALKVDVSGGF